MRSGNQIPAGPTELSVVTRESQSWARYRAEKKGVRASRPPESSTFVSSDEANQSFDDHEIRSEQYPTAPGQIAGDMLLACFVDAQAELFERRPTPLVLVDVYDANILTRIETSWEGLLSKHGRRSLDLLNDSPQRYQHYDAGVLIVKDLLKPTEKDDLQRTVLSAVPIGIPIFAFSPLAETHLPPALCAAATVRIQLPRIDRRIIEQIIRIVTGRSVRCSIEPHIVQVTGANELTFAVRFDKSPAECVADLKRLAANKVTRQGSPELTLDQLHGMREAVEWARAMKSDISAWRQGEVGWDALDSVVLDGPPGTGKTTFARVVASEFGFNLVTASLGSWQSSGEGHLGHLLRAMREDFEKARALAPCVLFIDEVDSIADRSSVRHSHRDYSVQVTNALLEQMDGAAGREGIVFIAASNDVSRCDPALLRAGRLNRIIRIELPDQDEREGMLRVRLGADLRGENLRSIAELSIGMTGADIEKLVRDARRVARQQFRALTVDDLHGALVGSDSRSEAERRRTCVHEAGHIVSEVIYNGAHDVYASVIAVGDRSGMTVRTKVTRGEGTYVDYFRKLTVLLAGRVAEEMLLGLPSQGSRFDLAAATDIAVEMVSSVGLAGPTPLVHLGQTAHRGAPLAIPEVRSAVAGELRKAARVCRSLLEAHRPAVEAVAHRLFQRCRIDGVEVAMALQGSGDLVAEEEFTLALKAQEFRAHGPDEPFPPD